MKAQANLSKALEKAGAAGAQAVGLPKNRALLTDEAMNEAAIERLKAITWR